MENIIVKTIENILRDNYIPIYHINPSSDDLTILDLGFRNDILEIEDFGALMKERFSGLKTNQIYFTTDIFQCNYISFAFPDSQEWFFCGPILFEEMHEAYFSRLFDSLDLPEEFREKLREYYEHVPYIPSRLFLKSVFQELGNSLFGKDNYKMVHTDSDALDLWYYSYKNYLRIPEEPFLNIQIMESHYEAENALIDAVRNGNTVAAITLISKYNSLIFTQRIPDRLRDMKNYSIALNTLLRKAAEEAGVHPVHIDCYSNSNVTLIEEITTLEQVHTFWLKMVHGYCELIQKYSLQNYSPIVAKVLTYISTDLCADLSLKVLAGHLSVNASYLSTLFKKEVGMTLTDYVNHSRIEHAQKLLLSTDMPIKTVAQQCGIPDVYYFTRLFKRITDTTPKAYRDKTPHETRSDFGKLWKTSKPNVSHNTLYAD